ncbi:segregation/condensation protein A [Anaerobacillus sp. MEB173]|uniref:segregation/condensation protein A n=1 Tax=Anaerobacillus sp. MEB173 TaxID=3383345 RepID=UPI003F93413E
MQYNVKLDAFEGPLDLLLHLVNKAEVDIYDIPVSTITDQYLSYIHTMQELKLDVASEYLVMAATLLAIKSKMLLPKQEEIIFDEELGIDDYEDDPRQELIERLVEYRKFKDAAEQLKEREKDRGLLYTRPVSDFSQYVVDEVQERPMMNVSIYDMLTAFQRLMQRKKNTSQTMTTVQRDDISIEARMGEILEELTYSKGSKNFYDLFPHNDKGHMIVTFLAVLELMKNNSIFCDQEDNFADIMIYRTREV